MERQQTARLTKTNATSRSNLQTKLAPQKLDALHPVLQLQRKIGNQAVQRLLSSGGIQGKLKIGEPGDKYEQEADRVADHVMRMPEPRVQRKCAACEAGATPCPSCGGKAANTQRKADHQNHPKPLSDARDNFVGGLGSGQALDRRTRAFFESRFGADFGDVRVHTNQRAADSARSVNARAYTVGRDIVFGGGNFSPGSVPGRELLAHELTHYVQQSANGPRIQRRLVVN